MGVGDTATIVINHIFDRLIVIDNTQDACHEKIDLKVFVVDL